jgi:Tol biopolymer transport system component
MVQPSADGTTLYYSDEPDRLATWDLTTGAKEVLVPCPRRGCLGGSVSPDGSIAAFLGNGAFLLTDLSTGATRPLAVPGVYGGPPAWSPDSHTLAFANDQGLWTVRADGSALHQIARASWAAPVQTYSVAWSPDGGRIAWFDVAADEHDLGRYTLMTVKPDGSDPATLHDAGWCECVRQLPPSLAWSPDGDEIAVSVSGTDDLPGVYTVRPDGTDWTFRAEGDWSWLSWQRLPG